MQERKLAAAVSAEIPAEAEVDTRKEAVPDIPAQVPAARDGHSRVAGKQSHGIGGDKLHQHTHDGPKGQRNADGVVQCPGGTVVLSCAHVLGPQRRHRGQHRGRHQEDEADDLLHDAHSGGVRQAAPVGNDRDEQKRDLDKSVLQGHRHADAQDAANDIFLRPKVTFVQPDAAFAPQDDPQRNDDADALGQRGTQRRTGGAHVQCPHKQVVQPDVGRAGHRDKVHRAAGIAQPAENGRNNIVRRNTGDADEADGQVSRRAGHSLGRGGHHA